MAELLFDEQSPPSTPSAGSSYLFPHNFATLKAWAMKNSDGQVFMINGIRNYQTASAQSIAASEAYVTNSNIAIPSHGLQVGTVFKWKIFLTKDAAGTATPIIKLYAGTNGSLSDTALVTLTFNASTAVVDNGVLEVTAWIKALGGGSASIKVVGELRHNLASTGFQNIAVGVTSGSNVSWDSTVPNLIFGLSATPGTGATWSVQAVLAEATGI